MMKISTICAATICSFVVVVGFFETTHGEEVCSTGLNGIVEIENKHAKVVDGKIFPITFGPSDPENAGVDLVAENDAAIRELARQHGAVLLRNFQFEKQHIERHLTFHLDLMTINNSLFSFSNIRITKKFYIVS